MPAISDDKRTAAAVRDYFLRAWIDEVEKLGTRSLTSAEFDEILPKALAWVRKEMDDLVILAHKADHGLHWLVDLEVPSLVEEEDNMQELALNPIASEEIVFMDVNDFFKSLLKTASEYVPRAPMTPKYVRRISDAISEMQMDCQGCRRTYRILEVKYRSDGYTISFSAQMGDYTDKDSLAMTFEASRSMGGLAGALQEGIPWQLPSPSDSSTKAEPMQEDPSPEVSV